MERIHPRLDVTHEQIAAYCRKWNIVRMELFGSVLRDDFDDASDVDVLVTFGEGARWAFRDLLAMEAEAKSLFARAVDLVERELVETNPNWVRRGAILRSAKQVYAA